MVLWSSVVVVAERARRMNQVDGSGSQLAIGAGTVVAGKYRVERTLAEGGMGLVVAATHLHLGQCVALKFLRDRGDVSSQWDSLARFSLEAKAVAQLRSEHVAHVLDAGVTDDGTPYMVMEYLEGHSLARTIQSNGALDVATAAEYLIQACEGLAEAHAHGIVHRDVKPYNLFLVERSGGWQAIKVVDFGISKFTFSSLPNVVTGVIIGSPCYMSPEQLRSTATVDHRSDIWSLGATLHELLAGRAAFDASQTLPELVTAILENPAPSLRKLRPEIPEELGDIVTRCLAKDREMRFQSAGELAMALLAFAPPRARVPAERAASMKPAFLVAAPTQHPVAETPATTRVSAIQPHGPTAEHRARGPSLVPVTMGDPAQHDAPSPIRVSTKDLSRAERDLEPGDEGEQPGARKWLGVATSGAGAALLFFAILFAAPGGGNANPAINPAPQSVAVPSLTRPEVPQLPTASLTPLEERAADLVAPAAPLSTNVAAAGGPAGSATGPTSRNRAPAIPPHPTRHLVAAQASPSTPQPTTQTPIASTGGEVDSAGGRAPLRPIETRDPYGMP
jgi:serine/threonine protein kinase